MALLRSHLPRKFMTIYAALFFFIISLTVWLSYLSSKASLEEELHNTNLALLHMTQQKVEMMLREIDTNTIHFIQEPELAHFFNGRYINEDTKYNNFRILTEKIKNLMYANSNIASIYLYSVDNKTLLTDSMYSDESEFSDMNWFKAFSAMNRYQEWIGPRQLTEYRQGLQFERNVITLIRSFPLISNPSFRKGAIIVNIDEKTIADLTLGVHKQRSGQTFIIDQDGLIISAQDKKLLGQNANMLESLPGMAELAGSGHLVKQGGMAADSVYYSTSDYNGWKYVSVVPKPEINKPLQIIRNLLLLIAAGMFLLAVIVVVMVNSYTFKPLERLFHSFSVHLGYSKTGRNHEKKQPVDLNRLEHFFSHVISENESMQKQIRDSLPAMKWRFVMSLLLGDRTNYIRMKPYFGQLGIKLYPNHFIVMTIELDLSGNNYDAKDVFLYTYAVSNVAEEFVQGVDKGTAIELTDGRVAVVISFEDGDARSNMLKALHAADLIKNYVEIHFKLAVTIGIGRHYPQMEQISVSYRESLQALTYKLIMGTGTVISIEDISGNENSKFYRLFSMTDAVAGLFEQNDFAKMESSIHKLFAEAVSASAPPDMIRQLSLQLVMKSIRVLSQKGFEVKQFLDPSASIYEEIESCANVEAMKMYIVSFLHNLIERTKQKRLTRSSNETILQVKEYIDKHYMNSNLSLHLLADLFGISVPYLSKLFKESAETNFMDYLIRIRMEKSKQLLLDPKRKISEIAESVGYHSTHSFIRIFKKYTGQTPGEYREQHRTS